MSEGMNVESKGSRSLLGGVKAGVYVLASKAIVLALATAGAMIFAAVVKAEEAPRSKNVMALECSVYYEVMARYGNLNAEGVSRLESQAGFMNSLYIIGVNGNNGQTVDLNTINTIRRAIAFELIVLSEEAPDQLLQKAIDCEGWREDLVLHVYRETEAGTSSQSEILRQAPAPSAQYQLPEKVSRLDVGLQVEMAFANISRVIDLYQDQ